MKKKEIIWFIGTIIFVLVLDILIFGVKGFVNNTTYDFNIHDTDYVFTSNDFIVIACIPIFFGVYFIRVLIAKYTNLPANLILIIFNTFFILLIHRIIFMVSQVSIFPGTVIYPPLSGGPAEIPGNNWATIQTVLLGLEIILIVLLIVISIKIRLNYKHSPKKG